jgi:hypothetical protein
MDNVFNVMNSSCTSRRKCANNCIEVVKDDDTPGDATDTPMISIHALTGIRPRVGRTMKIYIDINGAGITTLLDSRSTHNFVDLDTVEHIGIKFGG